MTTLPDLFFPASSRNRSNEEEEEEKKKETKEEKKETKGKKRIENSRFEDVKERIKRFMESGEDTNFKEVLKTILKQLPSSDWRLLIIGIYCALQMEWEEVASFVGQISYFVRRILQLLALQATAQYVFLSFIP